MKLFAPPRQSRGLVRHFNRNDTQYLEGKMPKRLDPQTLGTTPALSISAWFRTDGGTTEMCIVYLGAYNKSSEHFFFGVDAGKGSIDGYTDAHHWVQTTNTYTTSVWQHVFYQFWDYSSYAVTLNGDVVNKASGGSLADAEWAGGLNDGLTVGYRNDSSPGDAFWGDLAHITVWKGVLSDGEGVKLARGVHPLDIRPWAHAFYIPLDRKGDVDLVDGMKLLPVGDTGAPTYEGERGHLPVMEPMYKPMLWAVAGADDSGPIDLTVQNCSHSHAASAPTLTQTHVLAVQNGTHGNALTLPTIEITHILVTQDTAHSHSAENLDLVENVILAVQDVIHSHNAANVTLTQVHSLVAQNGAHTHTATEPAVNTSTQLSLADASHAHAAGAVTLTQLHVLKIDDGLHDHDASNLFLGEGYKEYVFGIGSVTLVNAADGHIQQGEFANGFIDQLQAEDNFVDLLVEESFIVQIFPDDGVIVRTYEQEANL